MPLHWTISHPHKLIVAVGKEAVTRNEIEEYLDAVVVANCLPYRKIFDLTQAVASLSDADMMELGARIRAYDAAGPMGPLAIVAATPEAEERARLFATLADAERPIRIFRELHLARRWLDSLAPSP